MNILDNVIGWVNPEAGYKRELYRKALDLERKYDAEGYDRLNANWRVSNQSAEMDDRYGRDTIRARARDMENNSDTMNAIVSSFRRNIYGSGYRLRVLTEDKELNKQIEDCWKLWCKARNCDVTATQSFNEMMRMAVTRKKVDGGILFLKCYTEDGLVPFKLQMIEVDELDVATMNPKHKGNKVVGGIEYNQYNKPVGYYIRQYDINGMLVMDAKYYEADKVIFYFTKRRPSQIREMSDMAKSLTRIRDINEFIRAVTVKERILSCLAVFVQRETPANNGRALSGASEREYQGKTLTPGMIKYLNPGEKAFQVTPSGQATDAAAHVKQQIRMAGSGQGLSYEATSRDMSESNYSSARQGSIEDDLTYDEERENLMEIMDEIFETFVISLVLSGKVSIPDFWENKSKYMGHKWIKAPKRWIDPLKEANANKIALVTGQKTFADLAAENGKDWQEQVNEIAEIIKHGEKVGVDMKEVMFGVKGTVKTTETDGKPDKRVSSGTDPGAGGRGKDG